MYLYKSPVLFALLFAAFLWQSGSAFLREGRTANLEASQEDRVFPRHSRSSANRELNGHVTSGISGELRFKFVKINVNR